MPIEDTQFKPRIVFETTGGREVTVDHKSRAERVLERVLLGLRSRPATSDFMTHVERSWTDGDDVLCLVYRQPRWYGDLVLGLRRVVESDWTIDGVVDEVLSGELGEPLGSMYGSLEADDEGVMWWQGNLDAWKFKR